MRLPTPSTNTLHSIQTDTALWNAVVAGDELSYTKFIQRYAKPLFNYGYRLCVDRDFLKDCIQDLFVDIWNRRENIVVGEQFKWYLFKSLRNSILREQAKLGRQQPLPDGYHFLVEFDVEHRQIVSEMEQELIIKVKQTLDHLPARQKEILYLRYFESLSFIDISQIMGISKQSSHNLLQKAYQSFREKWELVGEPSVAFISLAIFFIADN